VPLLAGRPALAHEVYYWDADDESKVMRSWAG
jgi:hypothetical protein